jgi:hypothetical protein
MAGEQTESPPPVRLVRGRSDDGRDVFVISMFPTGYTGARTVGEAAVHALDAIIAGIRAAIEGACVPSGFFFFFLIFFDFLIFFFFFKFS